MGINNIAGATLINVTSIAAIGAMHATGPSSLNTGPTSQSALQLGKGAGHLVTHRGMTLVVMNWSCGGCTNVVTSSRAPRSLCSGCSGGGCASDGVPFGSCSTVAAAQEFALEARLCSRASGSRTGSCRSAVCTGGCERHLLIRICSIAGRGVVFARLDSY